MESARLIETVKRAQNGDEEALLALYLDIHQNVYYLALKMMKNPNDAEDMTQEVFITIQEKIAGLQEPAAFYRWINQITANKCTSALRKRRELSGFEEDSDVWVQEENDHMLLPDKAFDDAETRRLIMEVIDNLPVNQRICVYFYYYEQLTILQIAETLDTNENTVKSRLALARGKIKAELERKEREEGIRLYAVPLALTPILRQALQEFTMPEGVTERMWENISRAAKSAPPDSPDSNPPDSSDGNPPGQGNPPASETGGSGTGASNAAGTAAIGTGMTLAAKIIIGIVAAAVVTAGAIIFPRLMNTPPDATPPPAVTDTQEPAAPDGTEQDEQSELEQTEPSATIQGEFTQNEDGINEYENGGTYEGEMVDGQRSGYGVWVYENYRYEGYWENDMPNGEGILHIPITPPDEVIAGNVYTEKIIVEAYFVNGVTDGSVTETWVWDDGSTEIYHYSFENMRVPEDIEVTSDLGTTMTVNEGHSVGVPPWWW